MLEWMTRKLRSLRRKALPSQPPASDANIPAPEGDVLGFEDDMRFAELVSGVRDYAVFLLDPGGHVRTWNIGAERIKGYSADEIIGKHFSRFYPREAVISGWPEHELELAARTGRFEDEGWRVRKDGSSFWANVVITVVRDPAGQVQGYLKITRDVTDRKHADEKLRLSEERFRRLVDSVSDHAIYMLDTTGRVKTWNVGAERLKGYTAEEIIGEHFSRFYTPESVETGWPEEELRLAAEQGRFEDEGWRVRKDGTRFWANVVITAIRDEQGGLRGFTKIARDLTDRREAEASARRLLQEEAARRAAEASAREAEEARQEEHRRREELRVTLASIADAVIVTDREGVVTFLNQVATDITGWEASEAIGQPLEIVFRIHSEITHEPLESPVAKILATGRAVGLHNHTSVLSKDGREIPVDDSGAPIRDSSGAIIGVVLVFRDVTEQRRSMAARTRLAAIVESSDDAIFSEDLDEIILTWNRGAERLYGYSADEIVGRQIGLLVPPESRDEL